MAADSFDLMPATVTVAEAQDFQVGYQKFDHPVIARQIDLIRKTFPDVDTTGRAYCRVEQRRQGHPWHFDTGTNGHMTWCYVTGRVLLSDPDSDFEGGGYYFRHDPTTAVFGYLDLVFYTSADNEHFVASHSGERRVLLMFLERQP